MLFGGHLGRVLPCLRAKVPYATLAAKHQAARIRILIRGLSGLQLGCRGSFARLAACL